MSRKRANGMVETVNESGEPAAAVQVNVESRSDKFRRLATRRVNVALKKLSQIRTLGNRAAYQWTGEQSKKIVGTLLLAVEQIQKALDGEPDKLFFEV